MDNSEAKREGKSNNLRTFTPTRFSHQECETQEPWGNVYNLNESWGFSKIHVLNVPNYK